MTDPIVSPWLIYFVGISANLSCVLAFLAVVSFILSVAMIIIYTIYKMDRTDSYGKDTEKEGVKCDLATGITSKILKMSIPLFFVSLFATISIPNEKYIIAMVVANGITGERVEQIINSGSTLKDVLKGDLIEIIDAVKEDKE